jgi:riboflavin kinase/FMN adenylyltransferase
MKNHIAQESIITIGNFDGVHVGHQKILEKTLELSKLHQLQPVLVTFEPYPHEFFHPEKRASRLTNLREKVNIIRKNNFDKISVLKFNHSLSRLSPDEFIQQVLIKKLNTRQVVIGEDFRFGHLRLGDAKTLEKYFPVNIVPPVFHDNKRISSTWIRETLSHADFITAKHLLGRDYSMTGKVIKGQQRGRLLGFPTANIAMGRRTPPLMGVYAVKINQQFMGIANLGTRPTLHQDQKIFLEVHLFDVDLDLYGQWLDISFYCKIRDEKRFDSLDALKTQIHQDVMTARKFFE